MTQSDQPDAQSATLPPISAGTNILFAPMGSMHCPCTSVKRPPKRKAGLDGESYLVSFLQLSMVTLPQCPGAVLVVQGSADAYVSFEFAHTA